MGCLDSRRPGLLLSLQGFLVFMRTFEAFSLLLHSVKERELSPSTIVGKGVFKSLVVACTHGSFAASHGCRSIFYVQERKSRIRRAGISRFVMACRHEPICDGVKVKEETPADPSLSDNVSK